MKNYKHTIFLEMSACQSMRRMLSTFTFRLHSSPAELFGHAKSLPRQAKTAWNLAAALSQTALRMALGKEDGASIVQSKRLRSRLPSEPEGNGQWWLIQLNKHMHWDQKYRCWRHARIALDPGQWLNEQHDTPENSWWQASSSSAWTGSTDDNCLNGRTWTEGATFSCTSENTKPFDRVWS